jgi:hypothetical protein
VGLTGCKILIRDYNQISRINTRYMKRQFLLLFLICSLIISCKDDRIQNLSFEGDLIAKQILIVKYKMPEDFSSPEFSWYISSSPDSAWERILPQASTTRLSLKI